MLDILIAVYRANPFRPHCADGRHVLLCRLRERYGVNDAIPYRSRCTAKDN